MSVGAACFAAWWPALFRCQPYREANQNDQRSAADPVAFSPINVTADSFVAGSQEDPAAVAAWGRGSGLGSLAGSSWTFACCLRLITSPIRPAITSNVPAIMSQCGSCSHSMAVLTISNLFFAFSPSSTRRR